MATIVAFFERMQRLQTAVACGTPDRVPLSLVMDLFAANTMGVSYPDFARVRPATAYEVTP